MDIHIVVLSIPRSFRYRNCQRNDDRPPEIIHEEAGLCEVIWIMTAAMACIFALGFVITAHYIPSLMILGGIILSCILYWPCKHAKWNILWTFLRRICCPCFVAAEQRAEEERQVAEQRDAEELEEAEAVLENLLNRDQPRLEPLNRELEDSLHQVEIPLNQDPPGLEPLIHDHPEPVLLDRELEDPLHQEEIPLNQDQPGVESRNRDQPGTVSLDRELEDPLHQEEILLNQDQPEPLNWVDISLDPLNQEQLAHEQ